MDKAQDLKWEISPITKACLLAVLLIALLATAVFIALHSALKNSEDTALVLNLSGKQRMLSQKIALEVLNVHHYFNVENQPSYLKTLKKLHHLANEMAAANKKLSSGQLSSSNFQATSQEVLSMFFGEMKFSYRF